MRRDPAHRTPGQIARARRDLAIVLALAEGLSTREVARGFGISHARVVQVHARAEKLTTPENSSRSPRSG